MRSSRELRRRYDEEIAVVASPVLNNRQVDWRDQWGRLANTEVAVSADAERFSATFFEAMERLADGAQGPGAS